jgi:hypothetical protein
MQARLNRTQDLSHTHAAHSSRSRAVCKAVKQPRIKEPWKSTGSGEETSFSKDDGSTGLESGFIIAEDEMKN